MGWNKVFNKRDRGRLRKSFFSFEVRKTWRVALMHDMSYKGLRKDMIIYRNNWQIRMQRIPSNGIKACYVVVQEKRIIKEIHSFLLQFQKPFRRDLTPQILELVLVKLVNP